MDNKYQQPLGELALLLCQDLRRAGIDTAELDVDWLLAHVLAQPRAWRHAHPDYRLTSAQQASLNILIDRRRQDEPLAYLLGSAEFYGLALQVGPEVLVPRPETELLVDTVRNLCASLRLKPQVQCQGLELGVGSGAVLCALQHYESDWSWFGVDISEQAVAMAQANLVRHGGAADQIWVSDWLSQVPEGQQFDIIVSNPPYLTDLELVQGQKALHFEPAGALASGPKGDEAYRHIINVARTNLQPQGHLVFEHADWHVSTLQALAQELGYVYVGAQRDLNGHQRVSVLQFNKT